MSDNDPQIDDAEQDLTDALADDGGSFAVVEQPKANNQMALLLGLILVAAGVVYFMYFKKGPSPAAAAPEASAANETITQFLNGGAGSMKDLEEMRKNTEKVVQRFLNYPSTTQIPLTDLKTNPFRVGTEATHTADAELELKKRREEERQAALRAVQALQLQSVIHSDVNKACMINNALYKEGQQVDGFTVEKISPKSVVVRNGAYRFELKMRQDAGPALRP